MKPVAFVVETVVLENGRFCVVYLEREMSAQGVKGIETSLPVDHSLLFFGLEPQRPQCHR